MLEKVSYFAESASLRFSYFVVHFLEEILTEPVQSAKAPVASLVKCSAYRLVIISSLTCPRKTLPVETGVLS